VKHGGCTPRKACEGQRISCIRRCFCCIMLDKPKHRLQKFDLRSAMRYINSRVIRSRTYPNEVFFFGTHRAISATVVTPTASLMPLLPNLLGLWNGGDSALRCVERWVAHVQTTGTVSPLGGARPRPGAMTLRGLPLPFTEYPEDREIYGLLLRIFDVFFVRDEPPPQPGARPPR